MKINKTNDKKETIYNEASGCGADNISSPPLEIPEKVTESLARAFLPYILKFYENEENCRAFELWKQTRTAT